MSRTVSARIPKEVHEKLRGRCNNIGCSINDFVEASINFALNSESDFDFGDEDDSESDEEHKEAKPLLNPKVVVDPEPVKAKVTKVSYDDGKTWINLDNSEENKEKLPAVKATNVRVLA